MPFHFIEIAFPEVFFQEWNTFMIQLWVFVVIRGLDDRSCSFSNSYVCEMVWRADLTFDPLSIKKPRLIYYAKGIKLHSIPKVLSYIINPRTLFKFIIISSEISGYRYVFDEYVMLNSNSICYFLRNIFPAFIEYDNILWQTRLSNSLIIS